ncbi:hypothetical protein [Novipirellula caenicola]|uniref:DUF91 domain-containing protein n=1 Tax=Novipirellula caenicola TaxID=1536901 RepID=A0ABP9VND6_9BACT
MTGRIFNIQDSGELVEMVESGFVSEDDFQTLVEKYPDLLAGDQIRSDDPRHWLLIRREMGVADLPSGYDRWSLDHLFIDQDSVPTLVEIKRSTDTRLRREVVGQILDYAANAVVHWSLEQIQVEYQAQCERDDVDPDERLGVFLGADGDVSGFWQQVKTNLQAGRLRLMIVADVIPMELRRIVEFLNEQMDPAEVLAVEIKHYVGQGIKTLVPRVIGQTAEAESRKGASGSAGRRRPRTEQELQEIADAKQVGEVYSLLVSQMRALFDSMTTTRSNVAFNGKIAPFKSGAVLAALSPVDSSVDKGLSYGVYVDRCADFFRVTRDEIIQAIPNFERVEETGDWAGDIYRGHVRTASDFDALISLMRQAKTQA